MIVDDHEVVRRGIAEVVDRAEGMTVVAEAGSAVMAPRGTPHTFCNAGDVEARYLLVMTRRIAHLIEAIHAPGADIPALFVEHDSELLPPG